LSLEVITAIWSLQDNVLSMVKPKNLVLVIFVFIEFEAVIWVLIALFCFVKNCRNGILCKSVLNIVALNCYKKFQGICYKHENKLNIKDYRLMCI
jgi:hypothetical protein